MAVNVRVAIVGAGLMGRWHADTAVKAGARVVAVVDPDLPRAERLAARHPGCRPAADLSEVVESADVVHVCSPTASHAAAARLAIAAGRHALVEKPLAPSLAETAELLERARAREVLLCPVHQFVFQDGVRTALEALADIGPLVHARFTICSAGAREPRDRDRIAMEILPHPLSLLARLASAPLPGAEWWARRPSAGELRVAGQLGAMTASILVSMTGRPTVNRMELFGARGAVEADLFHGFAVTLDGRVSRARKIAGPFARAAREAGAASANLARRLGRREPAYPGLRRLFAEFYEAATTGGPPPILPAETLSVAETCQRLVQELSAPPERPVSVRAERS